MGKFRILVILAGILTFLGSLNFNSVYSQGPPKELKGRGSQYQDLSGENEETKSGYSDLFEEFEAIKEDVSEELESMMPGYKKLSKEKEELKEKYMELFRKFEAIKEDRRNLLAQVRNLLPARNKLKELQDSLNKIRANLELMEEEKEDAIAQNNAFRDENKELKKTLAQRVQSLKDENEKLKSLQVKMVKDLRAQIKKLEALGAETAKERDHFRTAYQQASDGTTIRELDKEIFNLKKRKDDLVRLLEKREEGLEELRERRLESDKRSQGLGRKLAESEERYALAIEKNKALEKEARVLPAKLAEIVRQNKVLIKETARMHYNLGVFYTKNKEYERALQEFKKTADMTPEDAHVQFNLGYIYSEQLIDRKKAIEHFRSFLRLVKGEDKDVDWVRKYLLTWETYEGQRALH